VNPTLKITLAAALALGLSLSLHASKPQLDAPFVPTAQEVVEAMLEAAQVGEEDIVYDLGSGDGRIVITAAKKHGAARAVGVELDPELVEKSRGNAEQAGVSDRVEFIEGDLFEADFSEATVLALYLWQKMNIRLRPKILSEMQPGSRVVANVFDLGEWEPDEVSDVGGRRVMVWIVPANLAGTWSWRAGEREYRLQLEQEFQNVSGTVELDGQQVPIQEAKLEGKQLVFAFEDPEHGTRSVEATLQGGSLHAEVDGEEEWVAERQEVGTMAMGSDGEEA
jgi:precorrin-6B methylase 2